MQTLGGVSKKKQVAYFFLFVGIPLLLLTVTFYVPLYSAFKLSFCKYDVLSPPKFVGLKNWDKMFTDTVTWISLKNTLIYMFVSTFFTVGISFVIALGLNREIRCIGVFRTLYFFPLVTSLVAILLVWKWMFNPSYGILNSILNFFNLPSLRWLTSSQTALISIIIFGIWGGVSLFALIFLAGLQSIPKIYFEAASIDGASRFQQIIHITFPLISPTTFFVVMMSLFQTGQVFNPIFILTEGGPGYSTYTLLYYMYMNGFFWFRMGYAMVIAWLIFIVLFVLTIVQFCLQKRWVHYA